MGLHLLGMFNLCEVCDWERKKGGVGKRAVGHYKILGERLVFNISSLLTPTLEGKKHQLLVIEDNTDYS